MTPGLPRFSSRLLYVTRTKWGGLGTRLLYNVCGIWLQSHIESSGEASVFPDGTVCHGEHHVGGVVSAVIRQGHDAGVYLITVDVKLQQVATEGDGVASPATPVETGEEGLGVGLASMSGGEGGGRGRGWGEGGGERMMGREAFLT